MMTLYSYTHPRPALTVDIVIFRRSTGSRSQVLLIKRAGDPFQGCYALPGGFLDIEETLEEAAQRELKEETGISDIQLTQIQTFSDPDRDPRGRVISTAFGAVIAGSNRNPVIAGSDAAAADWFNLSELPPLAFDHQLIIQAAAEKLGLGWHHPGPDPD